VVSSTVGSATVQRAIRACDVAGGQHDPVRVELQGDLARVEQTVLVRRRGRGRREREGGLGLALQLTGQQAVGGEREGRVRRRRASSDGAQVA
jgi:hypothetical protein